MTDTSILQDSIMDDHSWPWIHSIYIVTFDIEFGQAVEYRYPSGEDLLNDQELNNICYSSFPDSNSSILGETKFHFRMRLSKLDDDLKRFYLNYNTQTTQALNVDPRFIFGYVYFLQKRESSLKRGYFQKSLVILSLLPFVELFSNIIDSLGSTYFESEGLIQLENIYNEARLKWPTLEPGKPLNLSLMGSTIAFYLPNRDDKLDSFHSSNMSPAVRIIKRNDGPQGPSSITTSFNNLGGNIRYQDMTGHLATSLYGSPLTLSNVNQKYQAILTAYDLDLFKHFSSVISDIQMLWEMILTCEPFIVIAQTPDICSGFVQALTTLMYPFKYSADYRPFFTIHDQEFREFTTPGACKTNVIIGVTNPFFAKSLDHWQNVIQLCSMTTSKSSDQLSSLISSFSCFATQQLEKDGQKPAERQNPTHAQGLQPQQQQSKIPFVDRLRFLSNECLRYGLNTKYRPFLHKDRNFFTEILRSNRAHLNNRPNNVQTVLIRRWLVELTQSFFMPLERYLTQLMPLHNRISAFKSPPMLPSFDVESFLTTLETSGPQLTTKIKGDWLGLYRKFFSSPNFTNWYNERKSEIDGKLWKLHMDSFIHIDLKDALKCKDEVEKVDMILHMKKRLAQAVGKSHEYQFSCENLDQFKDKLAQLILTLPEDLQSLFTAADDPLLTHDAV